MTEKACATSRRILWFRRDLRVDDHPALLAAAADSHDVVGLFVLDPTLLADAGAVRTQFLLGCLEELNKSLSGRLLVVAGDPVTLVPQIAKAAGADEVHISADYMPYGRKRDEAVEKALTGVDIALRKTGSPYAVAPGRIRKNDGSSYAVFTPYFRGWSEHGYRGPAGPGNNVRWADPDTLKVPDRLHPAKLLSAGVIPQGSRAELDVALPEPGEKAALQAWADFLAGPIVDYDDDRNRPDHHGTSKLSPYLKWGCVHPRTLLGDIKQHSSTGALSYRRELAWRDFYADLVFHRPKSIWWSINPVIDHLEWDSGSEADNHFRAWQQGRTGFPYIDAAMRQLLTEGWMHNRLRMSVASFLIKDLHQTWQRGAAHFMAHLVDGDIASNNHGWQWVAGGGPQASPFFRIFHPITQGQKFDPNGDYVRKYIPELAEVRGKAVHTPWELPAGPPNGYPLPIVDHKMEREETLRRWAQRPTL